MVPRLPHTMAQGCRRPVAVQNGVALTRAPHWPQNGRAGGAPPEEEEEEDPGSCEREAYASHSSTLWSEAPQTGQPRKDGAMKTTSKIVYATYPLESLPLYWRVCQSQISCAGTAPTRLHNENPI